MKSLSAVTLVLLYSLFGVSCILDAEPTGTGAPAGEAQQQLPFVRFKTSDFPFVSINRDDGKGEAGGWQEAKANLKFWRVVVPHSVNHWYCTLSIGMPLRTQFMGRIPPSRAARLSLEIAEDVARRMDYKIPKGIFCEKFVVQVRGTFQSRYPLLGVRVTR